MIITVTLNTTVDRTLQIDDFQINKVNLGKLIKLLPDGKGVNMANVLFQLGQDVTITGFVGQTEHNLYATWHSKSRVQPDGRTVLLREKLVEVAGVTRSNTTIIDKARGTETHMRELGFAVSDENKKDLSAWILELSSANDLIAFGGSLPQNYTPEDFDALLATLIAEGRRVAVDTSSDALKKAVRHSLVMIKPNQEEMEYILGKTTTSIEQLAHLSQNYLDRLDMILISLGKDGGLYVGKDRCVHAFHNLAQDQVLNTVGCGDSFYAGFLHMLTIGKDHVDCLKFAVACGSSAATIPNAGMIDVDKAYKFFNEVSMRVI